MFFTLSLSPSISLARSPLYLQSEKRVHSLLVLARARPLTPDAAMISLMGTGLNLFFVVRGIL